MTETVLDEFVGKTRKWMRYFIGHEYYGDLDHTVRYFKTVRPSMFDKALQDPRYIQHCKDQDRKEEAPATRQWVPEHWR